MKYYLFIDESGDHGLAKFDPGFPVFLLSGVLISEEKYEELRQKINGLKSSIWGNKEVIFHSRDIRKCEKEFQKLFDLNIKRHFYESLNHIAATTDYCIIASAIQKENFVARFGKLQDDIYEVALSFVIEQAVLALQTIDPAAELAIIIEERGKKEDNQLEAQLQKIQGGPLRGQQAARGAFDFPHDLSRAATLAFRDLPVALQLRLHLPQRGIDPGGATDNRSLARGHARPHATPVRHQARGEVAATHVFRHGPGRIGASQFSHLGGGKVKNAGHGGEHSGIREAALWRAYGQGTAEHGAGYRCSCRGSRPIRAATASPGASCPASRASTACEIGISTPSRAAR